MENIKENNKLIAEFLGSEIEETLKGKKVYCLNLPNKHDISGFKKEFFLIEELSFHNDWNWLMLVVDKIESLNNVTQIRENWVQIQNNESGEIIVDVCLGSRIEATYKACLEFIKWYNGKDKRK